MGDNTVYETSSDYGEPIFFTENELDDIIAGSWVAFYDSVHQTRDEFVAEFVDSLTAHELTTTADLEYVFQYVENADSMTVSARRKVMAAHEKYGVRDCAWISDVQPTPEQRKDLLDRGFNVRRIYWPFQIASELLELVDGTNLIVADVPLQTLADLLKLKAPDQTIIRPVKGGPLWKVQWEQVTAISITTSEWPE